MTKEFYIIGGGIAGLVSAYELSQKGHVVHVFEKHARFGGRIKTEYKDGKVLYETGPWRIHPSHTRLRKLLDKFGLEIKPIHHSIRRSGFGKTTTTSTSPTFSVSMTKFQQSAMKTSIRNTNELMQKTGYDMSFQQIGDVDSITDKEDEDYFVVKTGFSSLVEKLVDYLEKHSSVHLYSNHMVQDITYSKQYTISFTVREKKGYRHKKVSCQHVILALTPSDLEKIPSLTIFPNTSTVSSLPLFHIMAKSRDLSKSFGKLVCNSPISQIISTCFDNEWFQISYTSGRMAMLLENLRLYSTSQWKNYLKDEFFKYFPSTLSIDSIRPYFWRNAVHYYHPNFKMSKNRLRDRNIYPHPRKYPNLYFIGESISTKQGWIEGSLETVECFLRCLSTTSMSFSVEKPKEYVIYDNRILNVEQWKLVHPGSKQVIENHLGEDITDLWNQYHPRSASKYMIPLEVRRTR